MRILVVKNFGLNGENLAAGQVVEVDPAHFGDNIGTFREEGYFEDAPVVLDAPAVAESPTSIPPAKVESAVEVIAPKGNPSRFQGLNQPLAPEPATETPTE